MEAGYANGFKTTIWTSELNKERINLAEVIQSQLKGIGIDVEIVLLENGAFFEAINSGKHEMVINHWGNATGDADYNQFSLFHSDSFGASGNRFFYSNPEVDKLIEEGRKETDPAKREDIYKKTQEMEIEDAVLIPFRVQENLAAVSKKVKGYWINPVGYSMLNDIYLE
jgi:peptide/nickel transport system substrate-binding protein